jgi:DNA-binding protein YbaB
VSQHRSPLGRGVAPFLLAFALSGLASAALAAGGAGDAARAFEAEEARLEENLGDAQATWQEQDGLVRVLLDESKALETAYADPNATSAELRKLEDGYEAALDEAYKQARATIASRRRVYDQMDKLAALGKKIAAERRALLDAPMPGGVWRIEVPSGAATVVGVMQLEADDSGGVHGTFRLSNGRHGTVSGRYGGGHLELTRLDGGSGLDAALRADVDEQSGTLAGEWVRYELGAGEPGSGRWSAMRVSDERELEELGH